MSLIRKTDEQKRQMREEIRKWQSQHGELFDEPDRGNLDDASVQWRHGKPEYTVGNHAFLKGKTQAHKRKSLERTVENLVKTWEMEASHKPKLEQWTTVVPSEYKVEANSYDKMPGSEAATIGNYKALMRHCPLYKTLIDSQYKDLNDFDKTHKIFLEAFTESFPWEVIKVLAGPPEVVVTWRHWAPFSGTFKDKRGDGRLVEMYGMLKATVDDDLKITKLEVFFDPETFLKDLNGDLKVEKAKSFFGVDVSKTALEKLGGK